jgi:subtilisin family serine protease
MQIQKAFVLLLLGVTRSTYAIQFPSRRSSTETTQASSDATPRRYIVELKSLAHCRGIVTKISSLPGIRVVKQFDSEIFPGLSVECDHECNVELLLQPALDESNDLGVASIYKSSPLKLLPTVEGESFSDDAAAANYSVHGLTGVEKLHQAGILGKGAVVAIVDSGIQYTHPAVKSHHLN